MKQTGRLLLFLVLFWSCQETKGFSTAKISVAHTPITFGLSYHTGKANPRTTSKLLAQQSEGGEVERPDPSILLSAKSDSTQRVGVIGIGAGLLFGTYLFSSFLVWLQTITGGLTSKAVDFGLPVPLGLIFVFVGGSHFFYKNEFAVIVPPNGTWGGLWNVPTPGADYLGLTNEEYHVLWSGVAEIGGGALLVLAGLNQIPVQIPAFLLFLLTLAVTPANIYMFTHDAPLSFAPQLRYPSDHIARGVLQIVLLSLLWYLATHP